MTASSVEQAEADAAGARRDVDRAETELVSGGKGVTAGALHALRDKWRHATLSAEGARQKVERDRQAVRLKGLEQIGAEVDQLANASAGELSTLAAALEDVATACARVRNLAAAHDTAVADLVAAARDLDVEPIAPEGPRGTSAFVAVQGTSVIHKRTQVSPVGDRIASALAQAAAGDPVSAIAEICPVTERPEVKRPDHLLRGRNGMLLTFDGPLNPNMEQQIRTGDLTRLSETDIRRYMAGELG